MRPSWSGAASTSNGDLTRTPLFRPSRERRIHQRPEAGGDISHFIDWIQTALACSAASLGKFAGFRLMSISSVAAPASAAPINPVDTSAPKTTNATAGADGGDANATHQPPPPPPLPPGQGTRVDQLA
jgi:hypothetical protein